VLASRAVPILSRIARTGRALESFGTSELPAARVAQLAREHAAFSQALWQSGITPPLVSRGPGAPIPTNPDVLILADGTKIPDPVPTVGTGFASTADALAIGNRVLALPPATPPSNALVRRTGSTAAPSDIARFRQSMAAVPTGDNPVSPPPLPPSAPPGIAPAATLPTLPTLPTTAPNRRSFLLPGGNTGAPPSSPSGIILFPGDLQTSSSLAGSPSRNPFAPDFLVEVPRAQAEQAQQARIYQLFGPEAIARSGQPSFIEQARANALQAATDQHIREMFGPRDLSGPRSAQEAVDTTAHHHSLTDPANPGNKGVEGNEGGGNIVPDPLNPLGVPLGRRLTAEEMADLKKHIASFTDDSDRTAFIANLHEAARQHAITEQVRYELTKINEQLIAKLGDHGRWHGDVRINDNMPDADARFLPDGTIEIKSSLYKDANGNPALLKRRWRTLIHELLHGYGVPLGDIKLGEVRGWEEGIVEALQRELRQEILGKAGFTHDEPYIQQAETQWPYEPYIQPAKDLYRVLDEANLLDGADKVEFYKS